MRHLSAIFLSAALLLGLSTALYGQNGTKEENVYESYAGVYHPYTHGNLTDTPAPKGYKAFYISHLGRHGSRYPVDRPYVMNGLYPFIEAESAGLLTDEGKKALKAFRQLDSISTGVYGLLCEKGAAEHQGIGTRMVRRFPTVFSGRDSIAAISTHKQRCIMSAANFLCGMKSQTPRSAVSLLAGERYYDYLCREEMAKPGLKFGSRCSDAYMEARLDYDALYSRFFTDPAKGKEIFKSKRMLAETLFTNGTVAAYLGLPELEHFLTPYEFQVTAQSYNNKMYVQHCGSAEQGQWRVHLLDGLAADFIKRADAAVAGNGIAADLRFSHDVGMMPFFSLIGIKGYDKAVTFDKADIWNSSVLMCMATNMQMVFYRHPRRSGILVKILLNEQETSIPALGEGPYYQWSELRAYLEKVSKAAGGNPAK